MLLQKLLLVSPPFLLKHTTTSAWFPDKKLKTRRRRRSKSPVGAVEKESEFELDRAKAREALQKLDQQLQSLSRKEVVIPKKKLPPPDLVSEADNARDIMKQELPEFSDSYFLYSAFALLAFTIFYNILFITVIKPSIDGQ